MSRPRATILYARNDTIRHLSSNKVLSGLVILCVSQTIAVNRRLDVLRLIIAQQETLRRLNAIHVAGTKGKGSTCRLVSAFLESYHEQRSIPIKICMLTGPHLLSCTERIQMNSKSISEEAFAETFSRVLDAVNQDPPLSLRGHRMAQLVALMAIDYAVSQSVDFFVCEAFCGG